MEETNTVTNEEVTEATPVVDEKPSKLKWYIVSASSGKENSTAKLIKQRVKANGMEEVIADVVVPMQEKIIIQRGKKKTIQDRIYQGYIFVKMEANEDTIQLVRNTEGVKGFLGMTAKSKYPTPLNEKDLNFTQVKPEPSYKSKFDVGNVVRITDGPWKEFVGTVVAVNEVKGQLKVMLSLFNRDTPVDNIDFLQAEKLSETN